MWTCFECYVKNENSRTNCIKCSADKPNLIQPKKSQPNIYNVKKHTPEINPTKKDDIKSDYTKFEIKSLEVQQSIAEELGDIKADVNFLKNVVIISIFVVTGVAIILRIIY